MIQCWDSERGSRWHEQHVVKLLMTSASGGTYLARGYLIGMGNLIDVALQMEKAKILCLQDIVGGNSM